MIALLVLPSRTFAQDKPTTAKANTKSEEPAPAIVQGFVVDSSEKPIAGADVYISDNRNKVIARAKTGENGGFVFRAVKPGVYRFQARSVGYLNGKSELMKLATSDTLDLQFVLESSKNTLGAVDVVGGSAPSAYHITAAEIEKTGYADALDVVLNRRIRMLGDTYKGCMADTSQFTRDFRQIRKSPKSMSMDSSMPLRLYINGVWHGVRSIKDVLSEIPAEDIAEMNYVDCWDKERPNLRNSLMVVLKPGIRY